MSNLKLVLVLLIGFPYKGTQTCLMGARGAIQQGLPSKKKMKEKVMFPPCFFSVMTVSALERNVPLAGDAPPADGSPIQYCYTLGRTSCAEWRRAASANHVLIRDWPSEASLLPSPGY